MRMARNFFSIFFAIRLSGQRLSPQAHYSYYAGKRYEDAMAAVAVVMGESTAQR